MRNLVLIFLFASLFTGCIPLPLAAPPVRVSATFGGGASGLPPNSPDANVPRGRAVGRIAISPLSFSKPLTRRMIDPEFGMILEGLLTPPDSDLTDLGGYLGVGWRVWQDGNGKGDSGQNVYLRGTADLLAARPGNAMGFGGSFTVGYEFTGFVASTVADASNGLPAFFGYAFGEGGVGVEVTGSGRAFPDAPVWQVTAGLTVRIPALVGVMLLPVPIPK